MKPPKRLFPKHERAQTDGRGPEGLREWVLNFPAHWKAAYRSARKLGRPADIVLFSTPHNDRTNTPPQGFSAMTRAEVSRILPSLAASLLDPAPNGACLIVASKRFGRLQGSFVAMVPIPTDDEDLPPVAIVVNDSGLGVVV